MPRGRGLVIARGRGLVIHTNRATKPTNSAIACPTRTAACVAEGHGEQRAEHAAAVQGKGGLQVEDGQRDVDPKQLVEEVAADADDAVVAQHPLHQHEREQQAGQGDVDGGAGQGDEAVAATGNPDVKDAALIAAARRVEPCEMAGCGCARTFARQLGRTQVADLLQQTLQEEEADKKLTAFAEGSINQQARKA